MIILHKKGSDMSNVINIQEYKRLQDELKLRKIQLHRYNGNPEMQKLCVDRLKNIIKEIKFMKTGS
jgi:hypothetical protein